jgi:UDP-N-acetylmuramoyl-tripeptide--D-alanyl-D-alanine ligase
MKITIKKLTKILADQLQKTTADSKYQDIEMKGVSTDTRTIQPGQLFIAIEGQNFDGHNFLEKAEQKNAAAAIIEKTPKNPPDNLPLINVKNSVKALGLLAAYWRNHLPAKLIAITGSAGKTTTRGIITHCLATKYKCHQAPSSYNNEIGLPLTILTADNTHEIIVAELGANHPGEIARLSAIAQPDIALITNVHPAHLEGFGSIENIIREKASIALGLKQNGKFIINGHFNELVRHCKTMPIEFKTFGQAPYCDFKTQYQNSLGTEGEMIIDSKKIKIPLPGRANIENAHAAWAVCSLLDMTLDEFNIAISSVQPDNMRMQIEKIGTVTIINDCYNANIASMSIAVETLAKIAKTQKKRTVMIAGYMAELAQHAKRFHKMIGKQAARNAIQTIIATGPMAETLIKAAEEEHKKIENSSYNNNNQTMETHCFETTESLCDNLNDLLAPDDIILVKGSRCNKLELAVKKIKEIFK